MFYLRSKVSPEKKLFVLFLFFFSSSLVICFGTVLINDWKTIFDIAFVLKVTIFLSSVRFLIFHIFNTLWTSVTATDCHLNPFYDFNTRNFRFCKIWFIRKSIKKCQTIPFIEIIYFLRKKLYHHMQSKVSYNYRLSILQSQILIL